MSVPPNALPGGAILSIAPVTANPGVAGGAAPIEGAAIRLINYASSFIPLTDSEPIVPPSGATGPLDWRIRHMVGHPYDIRVRDPVTDRQLVALPAPLPVIVRYRLDDLPKGASEDETYVARWDEVRRKWVPLPAPPLPGQRAFAVTLDQAGLVAVFVTAPAARPLNDFQRFYPATGWPLSFGFKDYYDATGGFARWGLPLTPEYAEGGVVNQYFERGRLEWVPETGTIRVGSVGREFVDTAKIDTTPRPPPTAPLPPFVRYFPDTGHYLAWGFKAFYEANGDVAVFGLPLTEEFSENNVTVQYFERAKFIWDHEEGRVRLGNIGSLRLSQATRR